MKKRNNTSSEVNAREPRELDRATSSDSGSHPTLSPEALEQGIALSATCTETAGDDVCVGTTDVDNAHGLDGSGSTDRATVPVTVDAVNDGSVADSDVDLSVDELTQVTLDASASSDLDGDALTVTKTQTGGPAVNLSDASAAQPTFDAPDVEVATTLTFQVEVSDGQSSSTDTVDVVVNPVGSSPPPPPPPSSPQSAPTADPVDYAVVDSESPVEVEAVENELVKVLPDFVETRVVPTPIDDDATNGVSDDVPQRVEDRHFDEPADDLKQAHRVVEVQTDEWNACDPVGLSGDEGAGSMATSDAPGGTLSSFFAGLWSAVRGLGSAARRTGDSKDDSGGSAGRR